MLEKLFPKTVDNSYQGHKIAKWLLILYAAKSLFAASVHMFAADGGAQSIGSVALDQFSQGGANSVVTMFGLWGLEQLVIGLFAIVILLRYKALIPVMLLAYVIEYTGRFAAPLFTPGLVTAHTPPGAMMDNILFPLAFVMLVLSLREPKKEI